MPKRQDDAVEQDRKREKKEYQEGYLESSLAAGTLAQAGAQDLAREYMASTPPLAGRVYGDIVYWGTVVSAVLAIIGSIFSFVTKPDFLHPSYILSSIWQEHSVEQIWQGSLGHLPHGHWYLDHLASGSGLTEFGLAFGVFIVIPAMIGSAYVLFKNKNTLFASLAIMATCITSISMLGLLPLPIG
jgi:uncharacterized membrane protein